MAIETITILKFEKIKVSLFLSCILEMSYLDFGAVSRFPKGTPEYYTDTIKYGPEKESLALIHSLTSSPETINTLRCFDQFGDTMLTSACTYGRERVALELIKYDCRATHVTNGDDNALTLACDNNMTKFVEQYAKLYPEAADHITVYNETGLEIACQQGNVQIAFYIIATNNSYFEHVNDDGNTALILACQNNMPLIASAIMCKLKEQRKAGIIHTSDIKHYIRIKNNLGYDAMAYAVYNNMTRTIEKLTKYMKKTNTKPTPAPSPVYDSFSSGFLPPISTPVMLQSPVIMTRSPVVLARSPIVTKRSTEKRRKSDSPKRKTSTCSLPTIEEN
jgi:hypothetical protein